jgi:hypothetical protein
MGVLGQVPDQTPRAIEAIANRAKHAEDGETREAHELYALDYDDDDKWVCPDERCGVRMIPCAWKPLNDKGEQYKKSPYFRAEPAHAPECEAWRSDACERPIAAGGMGLAADYPNRVILSRAPPRSCRRIPENEVDESDLPLREIGKTHASWARSIRRACEYYAESADHHVRSLRVDGCTGATYSECFVRLGTGDRRTLGRRWIFYDQIRFKSWLDLDAEPIVLPLLSSVSGGHRTLAIHTADWPENDRRDLRRRLMTALREGRAAHQRGEKKRPWIFFVGTEDSYDQTKFKVDAQPGVEVLVCTMPGQKWAFRPSARFPWTAKRAYGEAATPDPRGSDPAERAAGGHPGRSMETNISPPSGSMAAHRAWQDPVTRVPPGGGDGVPPNEPQGTGASLSPPPQAEAEDTAEPTTELPHPEADADGAPAQSPEEDEMDVEHAPADTRQTQARHGAGVRDLGARVCTSGPAPDASATPGVNQPGTWTWISRVVSMVFTGRK